MTKVNIHYLILSSLLITIRCYEDHYVTDSAKDKNYMHAYALICKIHKKISVCDITTTVLLLCLVLPLQYL